METDISAMREEIRILKHEFRTATRILAFAALAQNHSIEDAKMLVSKAEIWAVEGD